MRARISKLSRPAQLIAAVAVLVIALGGTATAAKFITGAQIKDGTITGRDIKAGSIDASDLRSDAANALRGRDGVRGETGTTGPRGDTGARGEAGASGALGADGKTGPQGPKGDTGATGPQGPKGETGGQGPQGPTGADGSDATRLGVLDAHGSRLGDYVGLTSSGGGPGILTFLNDDNIYSINSVTGAYAFPTQNFYFEGSNCSGRAYVYVGSLVSPQIVFTRSDAVSGDPMYVPAGSTTQSINYHSYL